MTSSAPARKFAFIALGSNLDDPVRRVRETIHALYGLPESRLLRCSSLYRTAPVGFAGQPDFVNAVVVIDTALSAPQLLDQLLDLETRLGRLRNDSRNGPRHIDIDLLLYDGEEWATDRLHLPHPRMHLRAFVLAPLCEIAPDCQIPGRGYAAAWLLAAAGQKIAIVAEPPS